MPVRVINVRDAPPGWRSDPRYAYVGRGSPWGNPFSHLPRSSAQHRVGTRDEACDAFDQFVLPAIGNRAYLELQGVEFLVCYCKPARCHADSIARLLNSRPCPECNQVDAGQQGDDPCPLCGLPTAWSSVP